MQPAAEEYSLYDPLLPGASSLNCGPESAAAHPLPRLSVVTSGRVFHSISIAFRLLPSCLWAACTFALVLFTQSHCSRPQFNFGVFIRLYRDSTVDWLATILNCFAIGCYVLACAAIVLFAVCIFSENVTL
jgi:hypothetical protein